MIPADFCGSDFSRDARHFYPPSSRGIPAVFHSPPASESLSLAWSREVTTAPQERREQRSWPAGRRAGARSQEKAIPHSRLPHSPCAPGARVCSGFRRQSIRGLTSNWPTSCGSSFGQFRQRLPALLHLAHPCPRMRAKSTARGPSATAPCVVLLKDVRMPRAQDAMERPLDGSSGLRSTCPIHGVVLVRGRDGGVGSIMERVSVFA